MATRLVLETTCEHGVTHDHVYWDKDYQRWRPCSDGVRVPLDPGRVVFKFQLDVYDGTVVTVADIIEALAETPQQRREES